MLDVMRRNLKSLAVTLWIVIAAFILFIFVDWGMGRSGGATAQSVVATINDVPIYADAYRDTFQMQLQRMKGMFRDRMDRQMIQQLGLEQNVIESLVSQEVLAQEAERIGLQVTDSELRDAILTNPNFQQDGKFIGHDNYERLLLMNHTSPAKFESDLRVDLLTNKLRDLVTLPLTVADQEVHDSYYQTHEKVKISYLVVKSEAGSIAELTDLELKTYFEKHHPQFDIPERRKARYILLDVDRVRQQVNVTPGDVQSYYGQHADQFRTEEQVDAQSIVVKWEKRSVEDAKALAAKIVARARKGEDFAKLVKETSEDPQSAAKGGSMGPIQKGMVSPAEETSLFAAAPGAVTDPIQREDSWIIYKVNSKVPASVRTIQEAEPQIRTILSWQKAREAMDKKSAELLRVAQTEKSLDKAAQSSGLTVKETPLLAKGDEILELRDGGQLSQGLFTINQGDIDGPMHVGTGSVIYSVVSIEAPRPAKYEEVASKVRKALSDVKHKEVAMEKARQLLAEIQGAAKPEDVAKKAGLTIKEQEFSRNSYIEGIGVSSYIDAKAFAVEAGPTWNGPMPVKEGACLFRVIQKTPVLESAYEKDKATTRDSLLQEKRNRFFDSYLQLLRKKSQVKIDSQTLADVNQSILGSFS